ncbi:transketolase [Actinobacteria bacterium YIM 96077]|uniref:Transketolase n=1 Tax=Phytoactinopolyspora halophila TaxID=1981511 RepID=A0A329R3T8_9ACTN|nr:transketolase [Phytoactinopolyspora halophila]AYY15165.1 transketolase [Actinobacteria bacterium YIM 96077]RAW18162.1 transketolase [Phytoactinopolyspora halophila]
MVLTTAPTTPHTPTYNDLPVLLSRMTGDEKHEPSATSTLDVLWVLYQRVLNVDPRNPEAADRDRFLLSKGHGPMAYYAVLAAHGFFPVEWLDEFGQPGSPLGHHPDGALIPGVEIASGSLGHGLPLGVGLALGLRANGNDARTIVLVGDAELDEGSNHEAIVVGAAYGLDALTVVVIDNDSSSLGWPGGIARRFATEGWATVDVNGRDHDALTRALTTHHSGRPTAVVAAVEPRK